MVRTLVSATVSAALCLAPVAARAQNNLTPAEVVQAPLGATGALSVRIPLGGSGQKLEEPSYSLTFGMGRLSGMNSHGGAETSQVRLADIRFNSAGLRHANVASFDLAHLDKDRRFDGLTGGIDTMWLVVGAVAGGVAVCLLVDCLGGDDEDSFPT
jgi:hypothetical protein